MSTAAQAQDGPVHTTEYPHRCAFHGSVSTRASGRHAAGECVSVCVCTVVQACMGGVIGESDRDGVLQVSNMQ